MIEGLVHWAQVHGLAWIGTAVISIGVVWKFLSKYRSKIRKAIHIASEAMSMVDTFLAATEDKRLTAEEIQDLAKRAEDLRADLDSFNNDKGVQ